MSDEGPLRLPQSDRPELCFQPGRSLPIFARRDGVEVVVITAEDYGRLLASHGHTVRDTARAAIAAAKAPPPGLSTIEKDPEVADFLRDLFRGRMTLHALRAACVERFGEGRAPSTGRISTFRVRWLSY